MAADPVQGLAEIGVGAAAAGLAGAMARRTRGFQALLELAGLEADHARKMQGLGVVRLAREDGVVGVPRLGQPPLLVQGP